MKIMNMTKVASRKRMERSIIMKKMMGRMTIKRRSGPERISRSGRKLNQTRNQGTVLSFGRDWEKEKKKNK